MSAPEAQGMDSWVLAEMVDQIVAEGGIDSVTVVRNGQVVLATPVYPFPDGTPHALQSVTKSVVATLIGIVIDRGLLEGVDVPVVEVLAEAAPDSIDALKASMTVEDLLTMQSGLECRDSSRYRWEGLDEWQTGEDWAANILAIPMAAEPGTRFEYCNGVSYLLSAVISQSTGMTAAEFATETLFGPLGISEVIWPSSPEGISVGYAMLELLPTDMAKIGQLYLQGGTWDGEQVVSSQWIDAATTDHHPNATPGYGYQWWVESTEWIVARGFGGQYIFLIPSLDTVVVFTAGLPMNRANLPHRLVTKYILAATQPDPLPPDDEGNARLEEAVAAARQGPAPTVPYLPAAATSVNGVRYESDPNEWGHQWFRLEFDADMAHLTFARDFAYMTDDPRSSTILAMLGYQDLDEPIDVAIGLDGRYIINESLGLTTGWRGEWTTETTFEAEAQSIGRQAHERFTYRFTFDKDTAHVRVGEVTPGVVQESTAQSST